MSQIELAINLSRRLESLLEKNYQATGKGLHEKVSSVEGKLSSQLVKNLRYIATMRNSVVHQEGFVIDDLAGFTAQGDAALAQLGGSPLSASTSTGRYDRLQGFVMLGFMAACGVAGAFFTWKGFGGVGSVVMGFIGGFAVGAWVLSVIKKVLEMLLGLFIIGCVIGLAVSFFQ
jgi:hypothetical protein